MFVLIRHAKSDRPAGVADRDRPLAGRGRIDAALIGEFLGRALPRPGALLTSPAVRARETADLIADAAGWTLRPDVVDALYGGGVGDLLAALDEAPTPVVAVGHEPTWSAAVGALGGGRVDMVTAAVAAMTGSPTPGGATLAWMVTPALLGGGRR